MGYPTIGEEATLTSIATTASTNTPDLEFMLTTAAGAARVGPYTFTLDASAPAIDMTGGNTSAISSHSFRSSLGEWSGSIRGRFKSGGPLLGNAGLVTFSSGTVYRVSSYTLTMEVPAHEITGQASSAVLWKEFRPGLIRWSGSWTGLLESGTAAPVNPTAASASAAAATFKLSEEGGTDNEFTGSIITTRRSNTVTLGELNAVTYDFQGSGDLTIVGSTNILAAGALGTPDWDMDADGAGDVIVTFQNASGNEYAGAAFWRRISISVGVGELIDITTDVQGTGALTPTT